MTLFLRWGLVVLLVAHGIAHLPGFAVAWRLMTSPEVPFHTTLVGGRFEVGGAGIRSVGLVWLLLAVGFEVSAVLTAARWRWAFVAVSCLALASLLLSIAEWPYARIGVVVNVVILALVPFVANATWRSDTAAFVSQLTFSDAAPAVGRAGSRVTDVEGSLSSVPPIVARYFERSLGPAPRIAAGATYLQEAEFLVENTWRPLRATQYVRATPPGFVWDAGIGMAPGVTALVRDSYVDERGGMDASLGGVWPLTSQHGRAELTAGALHRYLAELVWMPSALLPSLNVHWAPIDERSARVTQVDGPTTVSLDFRFNADADIEEIFTAVRFAEHNGQYSLEPWLVRCRDYQEFDGVRVPAFCEVS